MFILRPILWIGVAVILFTIKVMHAGRPDPYFTSPSTHGWMHTWDHEPRRR